MHNPTLQFRKNRGQTFCLLKQQLERRAVPLSLLVQPVRNRSLGTLADNSAYQPHKRHRPASKFDRVRIERDNLVLRRSLNILSRKDAAMSQPHSSLLTVSPEQTRTFARLSSLLQGREQSAVMGRAPLSETVSRCDSGTVFDLIATARVTSSRGNNKAKVPRLLLHLGERPVLPDSQPMSLSKWNVVTKEEAIMVSPHREIFKMPRPVTLSASTKPNSPTSSRKVIITKHREDSLPKYLCAKILKAERRTGQRRVVALSPPAMKHKPLVTRAGSISKEASGQMIASAITLSSGNNRVSIAINTEDDCYVHPLPDF